MAILTLTSASGAPGVTTLAVGLALFWPRPVMLVDADPGAHQAVLAGFFGGRASNGRGLLRVAEAHRDRRPLREVIIDQCLPLGGAEGQRRLFLPGFSKPGSATHFGPVWEDLTDALDRLADVGFDVIVDCGRIGVPGLPGPLLERSALIGLVLSSGLRSVMSARSHLPLIQEQDRAGRSDRGRLGLIVVGEGEPYGRGEIARALGVPVMECIPRDPRPAQHLSEGTPRARKFESSPLARSLSTSASHFSHRLERSAALIGDLS